jgi:hypothetical protein
MPNRNLIHFSSRGGNLAAAVVLCYQCDSLVLGIRELDLSRSDRLLQDMSTSVSSVNFHLSNLWHQ